MLTVTGLNGTEESKRSIKTGTNLQAFYKHFYIGCLKTHQSHFVNGEIKCFFFSNSGRALIYIENCPRAASIGSVGCGVDWHDLDNCLVIGRNAVE